MLFDKIGGKFIVDDRIAVRTDGAVLLEDIYFIDGFIDTVALDIYFAVGLGDLLDFGIKHGFDFVPVNHSFAGDTDNYDLIPFDFIFDNMGHNVSGIAPL